MLLFTKLFGHYYYAPFVLLIYENIILIHFESVWDSFDPPLNSRNPEGKVIKMGVRGGQISKSENR